MKENINSRLTGLASSVLREKMIVSILSDKFPSPQHCNMYSAETRGEGEGDTQDGESGDIIVFSVKPQNKSELELDISTSFVS